MRAVVTVVTVATLFFLDIQADSEWSYSGEWPAEDEWHEKYPTCRGQRQSPVDFNSRNINFNRSLLPLDLVNYGEEGLEFSMSNNGHTVEIPLPHSMHLTDSDGTTYIAQQMHFHWGGGSSGMSGSEHTFDGIRRAIEIHIVHFNKNYDSYENAKDRPDGLAVLAVSVEIQDYGTNTYYDPFISELASVQYPGQSTTLRNINILNMLPQDTRHYYTYQGSLTTPPCTENVKWFVFREPSKISLLQALKIENSVMNHNNETIQNGYRQTQPLNKRVVEANFPSLPGEL
ncbi:carbonic anhydrase 6 [Meriones unguiculatus]|uniref:carbonic anhydrase 6 n=1 Tax=Meriones unguiculatus TaxID=10047 RepID=UPI000B4EF31E|nr:carbonic anhydrase 6 [Meriones unguiculatus]